MKRLEFSKLLAIIITILFIFSVCFITAVWAFTNKSPDQLQIGISILGVVATPFGVIVTGYFAKAGVENFQKIRNNKGENSNGNN